MILIVKAVFRKFAWRDKGKHDICFEMTKDYVIDNWKNYKPNNKNKIPTK